MSTFGKKALNWWDYDDNSKQNVMRFNHTDLETQLEILKKWYPVGSLCREKERINYRTLRAPGWSWEITGYTRAIGGYYVIDVKWVGSKNDIMYNRKSSFSTLRTELSPDDIKRIKREAKLSKLGF